MGAVLALTGAIGLGALMLAPVLLVLAFSNGRERRWVARYPVVPCGSVRPGAQRAAVYGRADSAAVAAPLSGVSGVWSRSTVQASDEGEVTRRWILWEHTSGESFGVSDGTGTVVVSAELLGARRSVASSGPSPLRTVLDEEGHGPALQQLIARGLVRADAVKRADRVTVTERIVPAGVALHVVGKPVVLTTGAVALTLPAGGRSLILCRSPTETERILAGDRTLGLRYAVGALVVGVVALAVCYFLAQM